MIRIGAVVFPISLGLAVLLALPSPVVAAAGTHDRVLQIAQSATAPLKKPAREDQNAGEAVADPTASGFVLEGFRSAKFGMSPNEVEAAIRKDFGLKPDAIGQVQDPRLQTTSLLIRVPNLIGDTGEAIIGYVFGYKSKALAQINVLWNRPATPENGSMVTAIAQSLRDALLQRGYQPGSVVANAPLEDGSILVFRGRDAYGRMTEMLLTVRLANPDAKTQDGEPDPGVVALRLSYVENPEDPDVFKLKIDKDAF